jgi:predicted HTH domain antitoxin
VALSDHRAPIQHLGIFFWSNLAIAEGWVSVTIPDDVMQAAHLSEADLRQELAVVLCQRERLTVGQAARFAGMDRLRFQHLLSSRGVLMHYDVAEFEADLKTLADLAPR